jgi:hypothetical protein
MWTSRSPAATGRAAMAALVHVWRELQILDFMV